MKMYFQFYRGNQRFNMHFIGDAESITAWLEKKGYDRISYAPFVFKG